MKNPSTGEIATLVSAFDWAQTPLGAAETWSSELKAAVELLLTESDRAKTSTDNLNSSLYNSQQRYETLLKLMDRGFSIAEMIFDAEGRPVDYRFLEVNSLFEEMTGLTGVIGKTVLELVPDLEDFWMETYGRVVLTGESVQFEHEAKALNRWYEVNAFPIDAPREFRFGIIFTDITDRRYAQIRLRLIQERFEISLTAGDVGVWDLDLVSMEAWRSIEHDRIFGYEELLPDWNYERFLSHVIPEDRDRIDREIKEAIANHTSFQMEYRIRTINGDLRWIWNKASTEYNQNDEPVRMYGVVRDINDRKQQEQNNNFLVEIQKDLAMIEDIDQIMDVIGEKIRLWFDFSIFIFADIDVAADEARTIYSSNDSDVLNAVGRHLLSEYYSDIHLQQLKAGQTVAISDVRTEPNLKDNGSVYESWQVLSSVSVPYISDGQLKFLMGGNRRQRSNWHQDELELLSELTERLCLRIDRARAEITLQEVNRRFETVLQSVNGIIFEWEVSRDIVYRSEGLLQLVGIRTKDAEPTKQWWIDRVHPEDIPQIEATFANFSDSKINRYQSEYRIRHKDGRWIDVWEQGNIERNAEGEIIKLVGFTSDISELKQAEQLLRQSEERLQLTIEGTQIATWDTDLISGKSIWSKRHFTMLGYEPIETGEATYEMWECLIHPDDRERVQQEWQQSQQEHSLSRCEHRVCRADNNQIAWLSATGSFTYDANGRAIRSLGVVLDISDRKFTEEALYYSRQRLDLVLNSVELGVWYCNLPFDRLEWNDTCKQHFGLPPETIVTIDLFYEHIHPSDRLRVEQTISESIENQLDYDIDYRTVGLDGQERWIRAIGRGFYDATGTPIRFDGVTVNITELKRNESALKQSEERYRNLIELIPQLIWKADDEGKVIDANQRFLDYTGLATIEAATNLGLKPLVHPDDYEFLHDAWQRSQSLGIPLQAEGRIRRHDGVYRWHLHQAVPRKNENGEVIRWIAACTDIEDQKQLERDYANLLQKLQERNQALDQFSYIVSHDLKAPLRAIANLAKWIEDDLTDIIPPENQEQLQLMRSRVFRMEGLIDGLLDYARIGRDEISLEEVSLSELLADIIDLLDPPDTFVIETPENLPSIFTKRVLLNQVLANLIGNGVKHHGRADGRITISFREESDFYEFSIADDGKGIPTEQQSRIFDIFRTLDNSNNKQSTGIGLAIVKKIVETEDGKIQLQSEFGRGSTFSFTWRKYSSSIPPFPEND